MFDRQEAGAGMSGQNQQANGMNSHSHKPRSLIVYGVLMLVLTALCLGIYFGIFIGMRVYGGG